ncbi:hypothetical protein CRG98_010783 [Punica granatum]|uniref:RNase H type-1 domain-containing protein n=1 Tax=Punica granatum TaxID=22663 RepID=A0A2I0KLN3_PUNGR|nr:hypothetical protein CRG98_010783 [Punica granatum]
MTTPKEDIAVCGNLAAIASPGELGTTLAQKPWPVVLYRRGFFLGNSSTLRSCGNPGKAGAGGVIRDKAGNWKLGFSMNLGITTSVVAELVAILQGLLLATSQGIQKLIIETDASLIL